MTLILYRPKRCMKCIRKRSKLVGKQAGHQRGGIGTLFGTTWGQEGLACYPLCGYDCAPWELHDLPRTMDESPCKSAPRLWWTHPGPREAPSLSSITRSVLWQAMYPGSQPRSSTLLDYADTSASTHHRGRCCCRHKLCKTHDLVAATIQATASLAPRGIAPNIPFLEVHSGISRWALAPNHEHVLGPTRHEDPSLCTYKRD
jgi:hypothetical protein